MNWYREEVETDSVMPAKIYIFKSQERSASYPMHWHNNLEFDLVLEGTMKGIVNGKIEEVKAGEFLFVNSGDLHETDGQNVKKSITVLISNYLLKEYCSNIDLYYFEFQNREDARKQVAEMLMDCGRIFQDKEEFYELEMAILLRKICLVLLVQCRKEKRDGSFSRYEQKSMKYIKKAISYMEQHYNTPLSLKEVSDEIGMSLNYFSRFFKKTTGETFYTYLTRIRLYYARQELLLGSQTVTEIALSGGFPNVKSFIEAFKRAYQVTPAKFRKDNIEQ